jgi:hypothetical protein
VQQKAEQQHHRDNCEGDDTVQVPTPPHSVMFIAADADLVRPASRNQTLPMPP